MIVKTNKMKKEYIFGLIITTIVIVMLVPTLIGEGDKGWKEEKEKICLPYVPGGIVEAHEGDEHCSEEEIREREAFFDYYCKNHSCKPVWKTESKLKEIYEKWRTQSD